MGGTHPGGHSMTEIALHQPTAPPAPLVNDIDSWTQVAAQVIKLANEICNTPFVPDGLRGSGPATAAAILAGRELGLGPFASLGNIHVIKGKTGLSALLQRALIQGQGHTTGPMLRSPTRGRVVKGRRKGEQEWTTRGVHRRAGQTGWYPARRLPAGQAVSRGPRQGWPAGSSLM